MTVAEAAKILDAEILCCEDAADREVHTACGSDMMSDVLAFMKDQSILLTGLCFVRGKRPDEAMLELAQERGIPLLVSQHRMFTACGYLYDHGIRG